VLDHKLLKDTLQKINASINKKFEKNAELYISKQDEYELKKNICNNQFNAVMNMVKGNISPEMVIKVLVRNAGIISIDNIFSFEKKMKPILENVDCKTITYMMEDVLNNTVYMEKNLKHLLFKYYVAGITANMRLNYWNGDYHLDAEEKRILFYSIYVDNNKTLQSKMDFIKKAFTKFPDLLKNHDVFLVLKEVSTDEDKQRLFKQLCNEMENPFIKDELYNRTVLDAYLSYGNKAFVDAVSNIRNTSPENYKQYIRAIAIMLTREKDIETAVRMFDTMVKVFESPYIKRHIKNRINNKVWNAAKNNADLYQERRVKIEQLLSNIVPTDVDDKYDTLEDITEAIRNGEKEQEIAYLLLKKMNLLKKILSDSFNHTPEDCQEYMKKVYSYLFSHSQAMGVKTLSQMCDALASEILSSGNVSQMSKIVDNLLLDNVLRYGIKGNNIKSYLSTYHFEEYKKKYVD